jgi:hypothetical protein
MATTLADLIKKHEEKLVDRAATSLKVMFGVAYADMAQADLEDRLYSFFDALEQIARRGELEPELLGEIAESVMVTPISYGWNNRAITEEVLRVIDFTITKEVDSSLAKPEQAAEKEAAKETLAKVIRTAKDVVNGAARARMEKKLQKQRAGERGDSELREASLVNEAGE